MRNNLIHKIKTAALVLGLLFLSYATNAQNWDRLCRIDSPIRVLGMLTEYRGEIYASASDYADKNNAYIYLVKWDGTTFCKIEDTQDTIQIKHIEYMCVYDDQLIVSGLLKGISGRSYNIAGWDGMKWHPLGSGNTLHTITDMIVYKDELYVNAGYKYTPYFGMARWDGQQWKDLGIGPGSAPYIGFNQVTCMAVYKNELYIDAGIDSINHKTYSSIAKWDGSKWDSLGNGVSSFGNNTLLVFRDELYVGLSQEFGLSAFEKWDGAQWVNNVVYPYDTPYTQIDPLIFYFVNYEDSLMWIVGANVNNTLIYRGDGHTWVRDSELNADVFSNCMIVYNGDLYCLNNYGLLNNYFLKWNPKHVEIYHAPQYKVYPTLAENFVSIETYYPDNNMDYSFYNSAGQQLLSGKLPDYTCCARIELGNYPPGIYFLRLKSGVIWQTEKMVIER